MHILVLQETDWITRGPHIQQHIFERLSINLSLKITVFDYDIDKTIKTGSLLIKKRIYENTTRTIDKSNVKVIRTGHIQIPYFRRLSSLVSNFFQLLKIIKKEKPDIIITYSITNGLMGLFFAKLFKIPFIFHYIDILHQLIPIDYARKSAQIITRIIFKFSDNTLVYTPLHQRKVIEEGASPDKVVVLPNGIALENTVVDQKKLSELKHKFSFSDDDFIIFFMGFLYDFAGLIEIIEFYNNKVKNGEINLKFIILGDGGIYNTLKKYVEDNNADWVYLIGRVQYFDITEYMHLADLCLLSFKINDITKEITPIKIIEYMAMKKPVLSNSLPGVILEIGKNNGVIFAKNQEDLIRKIGQLYTDRNNLQKIGQKGYELVKNRYVWSKVINQFKHIMLDLLRKKRRKN